MSGWGNDDLHRRLNDLRAAIAVARAEYDLRLAQRDEWDQEQCDRDTEALQDLRDEEAEAHPLDCAE